MDFFDETKFYKETLAPMIMDFKRECSAHNIPFFITVVTKNSEAGTVYHSDMILASAKTHLSDDRISKLLLRVNGFHTALPARVKKAEQILEEYLSTATKKESIADLDLETDDLEDLSRISDDLLDISYDLD